MCQQCDRLTQVLVEETLTARLMAAQHDAGLLPAVAVRPLMAHEVQAKVLFGELEDDLDLAVGQVTSIVEEAHKGLLAALIEAIFGTHATMSPAEVSAALADIQREAPATVKRILDETVTQLEIVLATAYTVSSARVVQEYQRQGGTGQYPVPSLGNRATPLSVPVATRTWSWVTQKTTEHLAQPAVSLGEPISKESLAQTLGESIKPAGAVDQGRQSVHTATGVARVETGALHEASQCFASELLDGKTCRSCAAVDGTEYDDMDQAMQDYPLGYYAGCSGNARCRGTLVFLFKFDE